MWDIVMGQGLGQLLPPPPSTTTTTSSPTIVVRTPPQSDGVAIQSPNSGSVDARPDKVPSIPSPIAADAAESLKFGTQCIDSGCIVNPTAKPDKAPRPTVEYLSSKLKTVTSVQKLDGASIQLDLGCSCSKSDKVLGTPPSIFDAVEDEAGDFSGLDDADPKSNKVPSPRSSTANFVESLSMKSEQKLAGWDDNAVEYDSKILEVKPTGWEDEEISKNAVLMTNKDGNGEGVKHPTWCGVEVSPTGWEDEEISKKAVPMTNEDEEISKKAAPMTNKDGDGEGVKYPTGWEDEEISKKAVLMINMDGDGEGVKYPTGWEDEEISKKAVLMTNKDGDGEGVKYPTGWEDNEISKKAVPMTNKDGNGEGVKHPTWCGVEVSPTGWEDEEISKKAVPMTNEDGNGEGVKYPTWWGVEVSPTGWEDEEISKKAVPMTNEDGNSDVVKYPTWRGVEVKPTGWEDEEISKKATGWEDEEISKKAVPMTNKDGNGEGVQYPIWTTGWEDGERSDKAFLKPNKDGSCEGVKYPERSVVKYPERPGQPDCSFYVHTGICKFGLNCKFNHPAIKKTRAKAKPKKPPEPIQMGISKLPMTSSTEEPVLGLSAPFHCPPAVTAAAEAYPQSKILEEELEGKSHGDNYHVQRLEEKSSPEESIPSKEGKSETDFPLRPGKPDCSYYLNTGNCQFGSNCRFNHPLRRKGSKKDVKEHIKNAPLGKTGNPESKADKGKQSNTLRGRTGQTERKINTRQYSVPGGNKFGTSSKHAHFPGKTEPGPVELNFLGLPIRPGERECTNYMHTGVCKFATNCRFHHPNPTPVTAEDTLSASQNAASPQQHASGASPLPTTSWTLPNASCGPLPYPSPPYTPGFYPLPSQGIYRHPGWSEYQVPTIPSFPPEMASGHVAAAHQPRHERPGQATCYSFAKTGYCKFKSACKYCHPKASTESTDGSESLHR